MVQSEYILLTMKLKLTSFLLVLLVSTSVTSASPGAPQVGFLPGFEAPLVALSLLSIPILRIIKRK